MSLPTPYGLKVAERRSLTEDTVEIGFELPDDLRPLFSYHPGQYLTLCFSVDGHPQRRAYSLCSAPETDDLLRVGVKRVPDGRVSGHIHDSLKVGDRVQVLPPQGEFRFELDPTARRSVYLFAAGSGITPILSIARSVLDCEPHSHVYLLYGSRDVEHIIFREELEVLQAAHPDRFALTHTLSQPSSHKWSSMFSSGEYWKGAVGRVDAETAAQFIADHPPQAQQAAYYICGPGDMIDAVERSLRGLDVADRDIHSERFGTPGKFDHSLQGQAAQLTARLDGKKITVEVGAEQSLLEALTEAGHNVPYSCQSGVCGQCRCKLKSGKAEMRAHMALSDEEVARGELLSCQTLAKSDRLAIDFG